MILDELSNCTDEYSKTAVKMNEKESSCVSITSVELLAATLRWFTAGGAIRIALRQLSQTWKLRHYDVIDDVITRKL